VRVRRGDLGEELMESWSITAEEIAGVVRALPDDAILRLVRPHLLHVLGLEVAVPRGRARRPRPGRRARFDHQAGLAELRRAVEHGCGASGLIGAGVPPEALQAALDEAWSARPDDGLIDEDPLDDAGAGDDLRAAWDDDPVDDDGAEEDPREIERAPTRDHLRSRRKREVRALTINVERMTKRELEIGRALYPETGYWKPATRSECEDRPRPCLYVSCEHHLYLDVDPGNGSIKLNFPDIEPDDLRESCTLDVADRGGTTLEEVAELLNITRERVRQIEVRGLAKLERQRAVRSMAQAFDVGGPAGRRRLPVLQGAL
jgi:hypothetical protein